VVIYFTNKQTDFGLKFRYFCQILNLVNYRELSIIFAEFIDNSITKKMARNYRLSITIIFDSPKLDVKKHSMADQPLCLQSKSFVKFEGFYEFEDFFLIFKNVSCMKKTHTKKGIDILGVV
jgi:hypothetical protein